MYLDVSVRARVGGVVAAGVGVVCRGVGGGAAAVAVDGTLAAVGQAVGHPA